MFPIFIIHSPVDGHLECSHFRALVTRVLMNIDEQVFLPEDMESFGYMTKSDMTGSCGRSSSSFLKIRHTNFHY